MDDDVINYLYQELLAENARLKRALKRAKAEAAGITPAENARLAARAKANSPWAVKTGGSAINAR